MRSLPAILFLLIFLVVSDVWGQSRALRRSILWQPVHLNDLADGLTISKRERLRVKDIRVGSTSIKNLFLEVDANEVSSTGYYFGNDENVIIKLKDTRSLEELRSMLLARNQTSFIFVDLEDSKRDLLRSLYESNRSFLPEVEFLSTIKIPIFDPCVRVTKVIFRGIDSIVKREVKREGQTEVVLSLDSIFEMLIRENLGPFMADLGPSDDQSKSCTTFNLLKWLRNEDVHGFEFQEYRINNDLQAILAAITDSLASMRGWKLHHFRIEVVGYTDQTPVEAISLLGDRTGVGSLEKSHTPLSVYLDGCLGDHLRGRTPRFVEFYATEGELVRSPLKSNCELGAVRAYVATAFMTERLQKQDVEFKYATGGVSSIDAPNKNDGKNDGLKRRIDVRITVMAADEVVSEDE